MSISYCFYCDKKIDLDLEVEHFNGKGLCIREESVLVNKLSKLVDDISCGELELSRDYKKELIKLL